MTEQLLRSNEAGIEELAAQLDDLTARIPSLDSESREVVTELLDALNQIHKEALTTVVRRLKGDPAGKEILFELVDDPGVRMMLAMHQIIRPDPMTLAHQAIEQVRPGLQSHGGDVSLERLEGDTAYVRLEGACNGCSMAATTMREGVTAALTAIAGITNVTVVPNDPAPTLIPLSDIGRGPTDPPANLITAGWQRVLSLHDVSESGLVTAHIAGVSVIIVSISGQLHAYRNECAHLGQPLDEATVDPEANTLTCPWHGFCYEADSGECITMPGAQLQQFPLQIHDDSVWIRAGG